MGEDESLRLRLGVGPRGEELFPTGEEAERAAKEVERAAKEAERAAKEAALVARDCALKRVAELEAMLKARARRGGR